MAEGMKFLESFLEIAMLNTICLSERSEEFFSLQQCDRERDSSLRSERQVS